MNIYISSSWKNRKEVRKLATSLINLSYTVYDFTNPNCRKTQEIPPELFPEQFDPDIHNYFDYLNRPEWKAAVEENYQTIKSCNLIILLLPCGIDATADWALGVGMGKDSIIVGHLKKGDRSPVHLWTNKIVGTTDQAIDWILKGDYRYED